MATGTTRAVIETIELEGNEMEILMKVLRFLRAWEFGEMNINIASSINKYTKEVKSKSIIIKMTDSKQYIIKT